MLVWMTLSAASKRVSSESLRLSLRGLSWTLCHAGENALLVKETMLSTKINKLMDFTERVLATLCFVTSDDSRFVLTLILTSLQVGL